MSPASGNLILQNGVLFLKSFHSINVPSEWEPRSKNNLGELINSFHSINVPSEWEQKIAKVDNQILQVSIQLMSPASGNCT